MPENRRRFIKKFGITLGSLIASGALPGCGARKAGALSNAQSQAGKPKDGGLSNTQSQAGKPKDGRLSNTQSQAGKPNEPAAKPRAPEWEQLRQCWLKLNAKQDIRTSLSKEIEQIKGQDGDSWTLLRNILTKRHQAILNTLMVKGQVKEPAARCMQMAYDEAVIHVLRVGSQRTCYIAIPLEARPRGDLCWQAKALREISGNLDPATVAKAQAAIAQDIAFLEIVRARPRTDPSRRHDWDAYLAGKLKASPEELEAARLLTGLFLGRPD